jgi:hypothetical protein
MQRVSDYLSEFALDMNEHRLDRMPSHYADEFSAVVDGTFVNREDYLRWIGELGQAGYSGIRFDLARCHALSDAYWLAEGTTTIRAATGEELSSKFSIVCVARGSRLQFFHAHSSSPKG